MRAIIAGFGFLGHKIAEELATAGYEISVIRRSVAKPSMAIGIQFVQCDLTVAPPALDRNAFDLAVFCLAPGRRDSELYRKTYCNAQANFLTAVRPAQYIYISSTAVYPDSAGTYSENEGSPHSDRAGILLEAERIALTAPGAAVLRLAGLYSDERPIYGKSGVTYADDKLIHFIHRDDAASAVRHVAKHALHGVYNVHDGNPQLRSTILRALKLDDKRSADPVERRISAAKFFATGFHPLYANYLQGSGLSG